MNFSWGAFNKIYWKCIHVLCLCYSIQKKEDLTPDVIISMKGFLDIFADLIPNRKWGQWMSDFIEMTPEVKNDLENNETLKLYLMGHSPKPLSYYLTYNKEKVDLFEWSWILHEHINYKRRKEGEDVRGVSLSKFKKMYEASKISKDQWGRPLWFVLHTFSLYSSPSFTEQQKMLWTAFVSSLQFVLPCPICREHINKNLADMNIKNYFSSNKTLFEWTVKLHNIVNKDTKKNVVSLQEAYQLYDVNKTDQETMMRIFL